MFGVLFLPGFQLQAALRLRDAELRSQPLALVDGRERRSVVVDLNALAARQGVRAGMPSAQALARCGTLQLLLRDPSQEASAQAALVETAFSLTPEVESTARGLCTLHFRISGEANWLRLGAEAVRQLEPLKLQAQIAFAPNPDLALLAARRAAPVMVVDEPQGFLDHLPVAELDPPRTLLELLTDWGIRTLHDLRSLPSADLADRLGSAACRLWQLASGETSRPLELIQPPEEFEEGMEFEDPVETLEPLLFLLRRFLDQLTQRIRRRWRVAGEMLLTLQLENDQRHEKHFTIPSPTAEADVLFRILHTHLEDLRLEDRPIALRLALKPSPITREQRQLFETALRDANRLGETLARLSALVGTDQVGVAQRDDTHRPDRWKIQVPQFHQAQSAPSPPAETARLGLPLRRFRPAQPANVDVECHFPAHLKSEKFGGRICQAHGPYRLSGHWWDRDSWTVEEWDVELENGALLRLARAGSDWKIEGLYDDAAEISRPAGRVTIFAGENS